MLKGRRSHTGIDAGQGSVKAVRLEVSPPGGYRITHWGIEPVDPEAEDVTRARIQALGRLLRRIGLKPRRTGLVAAGLGGRAVTVRQVVYPRLSAEEIRTSLAFEAKKHLPLDGVADPVIDFQILGPAPDDGLNVLLAAAPRRERDSLLRVLREVGIEPDVIDVHPLPMINALLAAHPPEGDGGSLGMLDCGAGSSMLATTGVAGAFYSRSLEFDSSALFGEEKKSAAKTEQKAIDALVREVGETARFFNARNREHPLKRIYLCGGAAVLDGLDRQMTERLGVEVAIPDPFAGCELAVDAPSTASERAQLMTATGLARWWTGDV